MFTITDDDGESIVSIDDYEQTTQNNNSDQADNDDDGKFDTQPRNKSGRLKSTVQFPSNLEYHRHFPEPKHPIDDVDDQAGSSITTLEKSLFATKREKFLEYVHERLPSSRIVRRVLKCSIAYFIASLFCLIDPLSHSIGIAPFLAVTGMLFSHPGRSMGAQFDATVTAVLGVVAAVLYAFIGMECTVAYNKSHASTDSLSNGRAINAFFLFLGIFLAQILRQIYPKFHFFSLQFMIIQIFSMTRAFDYTIAPLDLPLQYGYPLLIGHAISLFVNLFIWPETAVDGLGRALKETINGSQTMVQLVSKQFVLDPDSEPLNDSVINDASAKLRKGMTKVKSAYREAKYEMSYSYVRPQQLGQLRKSLSRLTKHLNVLGSCLKTEQELFESAIHVLQTPFYNGEISSDTDAASGRFVNNGYSSGEEEGIAGPSKSRRHSHHSYSEDDLNLVKTAAIRAAFSDLTGEKLNSYMSRNSSAKSLALNSRPNSAHYSEEEGDYLEQNQKSVSSFRSMLHLQALSIPKPKPPKKLRKKTEYTHRHLLLNYVTTLKDPLLELSLNCSNVLECLHDGITSELGMDYDDHDHGIRKTWKSFLRHTFKMGSKKELDVEKAFERHKGSATCNCSQLLRLSIQKFDENERSRMHDIYEINKQRVRGSTLDLGMRQELFLVFFFIFTLREVANELQDMMLSMDELRLRSKRATFNGKRKKHLYFPGLSYKMWRKWAKGNNHQNTRDKGGYSFGTLTTYLPKEEQKAATADKEVDEYDQLSKIQTNDNLKRTRSRRESSLRRVPEQPAHDISPPMLYHRFKRSYHSHDDKRNSDTHINIPLTANSPAMEDATNTSSNSSFNKKKKLENWPVMLRIRYQIWVYMQYLTRYEFKFALKMAIAVLVLSIPAFLPSWEGWYYSVRGQWAPMTVIAIMNPTSGGTIQASFWRVVGTLAGAFTGWAALAAGDGSPYLLGVFAVLLALVSFYIHLGSTYNKVGMVTLTTYEVVALSRYVFPPANETIAATEKNYHTNCRYMRSSAVELVSAPPFALRDGYFTPFYAYKALLPKIDSIIWPFIARHMVRKSISACISQLEDYYTFVMGTYLYHDPHAIPNNTDITRGEKLESKLQSAIDACSVLLELTDHEPRFRGPFPKLFYKEMITSMRNISDRLLNMRIALIQMPTAVKLDICARDYHTDRRNMIASLLLLFHVLAASLRSKTTLPNFMPSVRAARKKLMDHRRSDAKKTNWVKFRNLTWFAMACSTEEIIDELEYLWSLTRYVVGDSDYADLARRIDEYIGPNETDEEKVVVTF
ncbi:hypothetical protein BDF20DRAFT_392181 [Mycotypha africana]|uniref:uncharacterized protein n=1 Tax=Mycotypha africana TaxID=64632 RepID=UPI0023013D9C|nr:uncharacterized protein BDF20DRAFT_392181 [Mycotypha africana]KAI8984474.1 hypothetical protein BDF20DRAFT_392181 [Mycotypha africana]